MEYFRLKVFGPTVIFDYWPGQAPPPSLEGQSGERGGDAKYFQNALGKISHGEEEERF